LCTTPRPGRRGLGRPIDGRRQAAPGRQWHDWPGRGAVG